MSKVLQFVVLTDFMDIRIQSRVKTKMLDESDAFDSEKPFVPEDFKSIHPRVKSLFTVSKSFTTAIHFGISVTKKFFLLMMNESS